jgi:hypothetical protein
VDRNYRIEGKFVASASTGFHQEHAFDSNFGAGIEGEARINFTYNPMIAAINSGTAGASFHWTFQKAEGKVPIGGLDIKIIIERPREIKEMYINWEVTVQFNKKWHNHDTATSQPVITELGFKESLIE